jgi:NADPH:quinone reductase
MRAIVVDRWLSGVRDLTVTEAWPVPAVDDDSVLVRIEVVGANFFDLLLVTGKYQFKPAFPFIPGAEVRAGVHGPRPSNPFP